MKIIVTGCAGMIGSNLVRKLLIDGHDVIGIDNLWRGTLNNMEYFDLLNHPNFHFHNYDLSVFSTWIELFKGVEVVYHLADIVAGIGYVFNNQASIFRSNLLINVNVANACQIQQVNRYVYVGTACSFPLELQTGVEAKPMKEEQQFPAHPESAYGWSKLMGELDAKYISEESDIDTVVLVFHNVYGFPCDYSTDKAQVIPALINRTCKSFNDKTDALVIWGDGSQGRAFVHVDDIVSALVLSLDKGENVGPIQIGPNICTSIKEVASEVVKHFERQIDLQFDTTMPTGDKGRCADYSKASSILGWEPKVRFDDGIKRLVESIKSDIND